MRLYSSEPQHQQYYLQLGGFWIIKSCICETLPTTILKMENGVHKEPESGKYGTTSVEET